MPSVSQWWVFIGAALLLAVIPGPGILYVLSRSLHGGRAEGVRSALGNALGALVHVGAATAGLSALFATSAVAFTIVKLVGAAYLVYLGGHALRERAMEPAGPEPTVRSGSVLLQGFVTEALNPKTAVFFLAFLPQFVHPERAGPRSRSSFSGWSWWRAPSRPT